MGEISKHDPDHCAHRARNGVAVRRARDVAPLSLTLPGGFDMAGQRHRSVTSIGCRRQSESSDMRRLDALEDGRRTRGVRPRVHAALLIWTAILLVVSSLAT